MIRTAIDKTRLLLSKRHLIVAVVPVGGRSEVLDGQSFDSSRVASSSSLRGCPSTEIRRALSSYPLDSAVTQEDCFGEKVTILDLLRVRDTAFSSYDQFLLAVLTKGKAMSGGGNEEGLQRKASHSAAIAWSELLETAAFDSVPMMAVLAIVPVLVQADMTYLRRMDELLLSTRDKIQLNVIATNAVAQKDNASLNLRERQHLHALDLLMQHKRSEALEVYLQINQMCPGDALALSFAIDLSSTLGDKRAALRAATTVYSYWQDRQRSISCYSIGASLIAVGLAAGGRFSAAEGLLHNSMSSIDLDGSLGIASWASGLVYDAEGRIAEGITALNGYDGVKKFEAAGLLFFDSRLCGYGARFALDREGRRNGRSIVRVYDESYTRVCVDSGYAMRQPHVNTEKRVPSETKERFLKPANSLLQSIFGGQNIVKTAPKNAQSSGVSLPTSVDTLTWLPPTPQLLTDASFLLLRITLHDSIDSSDDRWHQLKNSWLTLLDQYQGDYSSLPEPVKIASALVCHDIIELRFEQESSAIAGARLIGDLMWLGTSPPTTPSSPEEWKKAVHLLSEIPEGSFWDIDARPLFEIALCHAACMTANDLGCLSIARSVCSKGVALRMNSPEEWSRYSKVLEGLGDEVAAEEARIASASMGSGEGGYGSS